MVVVILDVIVLIGHCPRLPLTRTSYVTATSSMLLQHALLSMSPECTLLLIIGG